MVAATEDQASSDGQLRAMWASFGGRIPGALRNAGLAFGANDGNHEPVVEPQRRALHVRA